MADVRLTATNPDDSTVVPVACNAKGELKLEEPPTFDGNLNGDLVVTGSGTFGTTVNTSTWPNNGSTSTGGGAHLVRNDTGDNVVWKAFSGGTGDDYVTSSILGNGEASFKGDVSVGYKNTGTGVTLNNSGQVFIQSKTTAIQIQDADNSNANTVLIDNDGAASFAGGVNLLSTTTDGMRINSEGEITVQRSDGGDFLFRGYDGTTKTVEVTASGAVQTKDALRVGEYGPQNPNDAGVQIDNIGNVIANRKQGNDSCFIARLNNDTRVIVRANGSAEFYGEVTVTSRGQKWVLTEQGGICYMMAPSSEFDDGFSQTPPRDVIKELDQLKELVQTLINSRNETD